jgi:hypothetical protein
MRGLAEHLSENGETWEIVGLCYDLDYFETAADRTQHGFLTALWVGDRLPDAARQAIAAHDHRTGARADTRLADLLKAADAAAIIDQRLGREVWRQLDHGAPYDGLRSRLGERAYLADILEVNASKHALPIGRIAELMLAAPRQ